MATRLPESYQQIDHILEMLHQLHTEIGLHCEKAVAECRETRDGQLIGLFAERQKEMTNFIADIRRECDPKVLVTWMQFVPFEDVEKLREEMQMEFSLEDFPEQVLGMQGKIAEFIQSLDQESEFLVQHDLFKLLGERERGEAKYCTAILRGLEDV